MTADEMESEAATAAPHPDKETPAVPVETDKPTDAAVEAPEGEAVELIDTEGEEAAELSDEGQTPAAAITDPAAPKKRIDWSRVLAYGMLPGLALILALAAGFLKWQDSSIRDSAAARAESVQVAKDSTIKLLTYKPDTVAQDLGAARDLLTGSFRDSYTQLTDDVVIPGSKQQQISATASVPAVASVSANPNHAVVLVFVNQTTIVGNGAPSASASSVRVTLEKAGGRWLISDFTPI